MKILNKDKEKLEKVIKEMNKRKATLEEVETEITVTKKEIVEIKEEKQALLLKGLGALSTVALNTAKIAKLELKLEQLTDMCGELKLELKKFLESKLEAILLEKNKERLEECRLLHQKQLEKAFELNNQIWECYDNAENITNEHHQLLNNISEIIEDEELEIEHRAVSILKYRSVQEAKVSFLDLKNHVFTGHTPTPSRKYKDLD